MNTMHGCHRDCYFLWEEEKVPAFYTSTPKMILKYLVNIYFIQCYLLSIIDYCKYFTFLYFKFVI